jgi:hypothetical protein
LSTKNIDLIRLGKRVMQIAKDNPDFKYRENKDKPAGCFYTAPNGDKYQRDETAGCLLGRGLCAEYPEMIEDLVEMECGVSSAFSELQEDMDLFFINEDHLDLLSQIQHYQDCCYSWKDAVICGAKDWIYDNFVSEADEHSVDDAEESAVDALHVLNMPSEWIDDALKMSRAY